MLWGAGRLLSGLEGRSAASSRRTWAGEGKAVRIRLSQGHMWIETVSHETYSCPLLGWTVTLLSGTTTPLARMLSHPCSTCLPISGVLSWTFRLKQIPIRHFQRPCTLLLEQLSLGMMIYVAPPKEDQHACFPHCLAQGTNDMVKECLWRNGQMDG